MTARSPTVVDRLVDAAIKAPGIGLTDADTRLVRQLEQLAHIVRRGPADAAGGRSRSGPTSTATSRDADGG
jgi:hypothetical protein